MVTGQTPFRGTPAEVMYQHQHASLPLERLQDVPRPVVVLLKKLLEKDPARRFQTRDDANSETTVIASRSVGCEANTGLAAQRIVRKDSAFLDDLEERQHLQRSFLANAPMPP
jgi:hypothetical protein